MLCLLCPLQIFKMTPSFLIPVDVLDAFHIIDVHTFVVFFSHSTAKVNALTFFQYFPSWHPYLFMEVLICVPDSADDTCHEIEFYTGMQQGDVLASKLHIIGTLPVIDSPS